MTILKWMLKIVVFPVMVAVTLFQWAGLFIIGFSSVFFNLFAGLCFLAAVSTYVMGISTGAEMVRVMMIGFVSFMIPHAGEAMISCVVAVNCGLRDFLWS